MKRMAAILGLALATLGCNDPPSRTFSSEDLGKLAENRLKGIAEDKSLADVDAYKKYLDSHPMKPRIILPPTIAPWTEVRPAATGDGFHLFIRDEENPFQDGGSADNMVSSERLRIKAYAEFIRDLFVHFEGRKLERVTVTLFKALSTEKTHIEVFRATAAVADLPKLKQLAGEAAAGSVFDPRGPKIGEIWKIELNRYPEIEYRKK